MTTRLQTALARREQLTKVKTHLLELDKRLDQTRIALDEIEQQIRQVKSQIDYLDTKKDQLLESF